MKIQQLLIIIIVICQTSIADDNQEKINYLQTKKIPVAIQNGCRQTSIRECALLNSYLEQATQYYLEQAMEYDRRLKHLTEEEVTSLENQKKELQEKDSLHPFIAELIEKDYYDAKKYLNETKNIQSKKFLDTLTLQEYQEFKSAVNEVVRRYVQPSEFLIAYEQIAQALEK